MIENRYLKSSGVTALLTFFILTFAAISQSGATALYQHGLYVVPYPRQVVIEGENFTIDHDVVIVIDQGASSDDQFAAEELSRDLRSEYGINATVDAKISPGCIVLTRKDADKKIGEQGYQLLSAPGQLIIKANGASGLFYGTQTLLQLIKKEEKGYFVLGMEITDWPDVKERAMHYDTKHHQDKESYVKHFIRDLARYKVNMLVWEWEDKLAYPSHPEIGAPGAFTVEQMKEFTRYARKYHIQLVPLVQGLGHVSFILKWPQYAHLREVASSNWEFCPLKNGSYDLLFDLWEDAIKATPGSNYIHIGSDETFELASCDACKSKADQIGTSGLYHLFVSIAAKHLKALDREVMVWERPMGWKMSSSPAVGIKPESGLVLTESYGYEEPDFRYAKEAKALGYKVFAYDPNPGIEQLFLPYFYREKNDQRIMGSLENSYQFVSSATISGVFDGVINTSWDDAGLNNQVWMLSFVTSAAFSWNGRKPDLDEFTDSFFKSYYGPNSMNMKELFYLLNEGAYYYMSTFERNVWHYGDVGKTHLPDLPRGDAMEYDPYWNREYHDMLEKSEEIDDKMRRASSIIADNLKSGVKNSYDFEVFETIVDMIRHTAHTYRDLSELEHLITNAHQNHFVDYATAYDYLNQASDLIEHSLERRKQVFDNLVTVWEKTRLPKGMSTDEKQYFFQQDRARHFANRRPDLTYLIYDEQLLDLEGYLEKLRDYMKYYQKTYLD